MKEPSKTSGGLLYRMTVEFAAVGVGGDKESPSSANTRISTAAPT